MRLVTCDAMDVGTYATRVLERGRGIFVSKAMRDNVAVLLKHSELTIVKSSIRGQNLHPEYVTDYVGSYRTGFGNTDYNTHFPVLYKLEVVRH